IDKGVYISRKLLFAGVIPLINSIKDLEMAIAYWNLIFTGRFKFLDLWCEFLRSHYKRAGNTQRHLEPSARVFKQD
uniref:Defective in cullin neddylation protein n=1 Tax=Amphimedon queenslandica TaxID=400682 RepID=A0A1X7SM77_AMPQE